jgi:hypothetical protein
VRFPAGSRGNVLRCTMRCRCAARLASSRQGSLTTRPPAARPR